MKKNFLIRANLLGIFTICISALLFIGCAKDDSVEKSDQNPSEQQISTRAPQYHWTCSKCGLLNAGWRDKCAKPSCPGKYSNEHGNLIVSFMDSGVTTAQTTLEGIGDYDNTNRIQLPNLEYTAKAPEPWYDTYKSQTYYENLKTLAYYSDTKYAEGVDLGWYRTVRVLYPGQTNVTKMQRVYDRWVIGEGRLMRDSFGRGLKAGTKAAVDAFGAR